MWYNIFNGIWNIFVSKSCSGSSDNSETLSYSLQVVQNREQLLTFAAIDCNIILIIRERVNHGKTYFELIPRLCGTTASNMKNDEHEIIVQKLQLKIRCRHNGEHRIISLFHTKERPKRKTYTKITFNLTFVQIPKVQPLHEKTNQNCRSLLYLWDQLEKSCDGTSDVQCFIVTTLLITDSCVQLKHDFVRIFGLWAR